MKLEQQVCSLEQGVKLSELGISAEQNFAWLNDRVALLSSLIDDCGNVAFDAPAFTVAELFAMLPPNASCERGHTNNWWWPMWDAGEYWFKELPPDGYRTQAEGLGALLLHLLENNLTTAEDCNKRLSQ